MEVLELLEIWTKTKNIQQSGKNLINRILQSETLEH